MEAQVVHIHAGLVEACRNGDRKAQFELYNNYCKAMYNICMRMLNNEADAEDVLQESFIDAFKNISYYRGESTFGAWLKRIVINHCINFMKKKKLPLTELDDKQNLISESDEQSYDSDKEQDINRIRKGIQLLPDGYRVVLSLYLVEGYDHSEIAYITGISESTSKSQLNRAKKKLREIVSTL